MGSTAEGQPGEGHIFKLATACVNYNCSFYETIF